MRRRRRPLARGGIPMARRARTGMEAVVVAGALALAPSAWAGDDVAAEIEALKRRVEAQDRRIRELEGSRLTDDEITSAVDRYLEGTPGAILVGADEPKGSAGFPKGKHPFIKE